MIPTAELPNSIEELQQLVRSLTHNVQQLETKVRYLEELNQLLLHKRFGANTEKYRPEQSDLFNEAEVYAEHPEAEEITEPETVDASVVAITKPRPSSRQPGRKVLPVELPRVDVIHDLPEHQRFCAEGHPLREIGETIGEQLDIIPAQVQVLRHVRKKYACPCCQGHLLTAALPPQPIPKSNASPGLLAYVATSKFLDALPLYRQSKQFERFGIGLPRSTLAFWMIRSGELLIPLHTLMADTLLCHPYLQMDETTIQVLKEPDKDASSNSYVWVRRGGPVDKPVVLFDYASSRRQAVAQELLVGFTGTLQSDGYRGYSGLCAKNSFQHAGCWAHARRKFDEALKGSKGKSGKASKALLMIQKLYRVETLIKELPPDQKTPVRKAQAVPILNEIKTWLDLSLTQVAPSGLTGKALAYLANQWPSLIVYVNDGHIDIDNNRVERAIRPFVIGRNNWIFSDSVSGAKASARLYSLIETAKLNGLEPYRYLRYVFTELPKAKTLEELEQLLPWAVDKDIINDGWYQA